MSDLAVTSNIVARVLDAAPDGLLLVDAAGQITLVNDRVEHMFGYGRADLVGHTVEVLLPEAFRQVHLAHRQRCLDQPRTRPMGAGLALSGRRKDGSEFAVEASLSPLDTGDGRWVVACIRDATEGAAHASAPPKSATRSSGSVGTAPSSPSRAGSPKIFISPSSVASWA